MLYSNRSFALTRVCNLTVVMVIAIAASISLARGQAPPAPNPSPFGPNVYVITPSMTPTAINTLLNQLNQETQFSTNRYAVLFQPGVYGTTSNIVGAQVGFYEQISGLGELPTGVDIVGGFGADQLINGNMTQNFWRSIENLSEQAQSGPTGVLDWGVSQGASLRRLNIQSSLWLANSQPVNGLNACQESSGGFMADTLVVGQVNACSQQQWYTRNSVLNQGFEGNVWNFVFSGVTGAPKASYPGGSAGDDNVTVLANTPVSREKPFLHVDSSGNYYVFIPAAQTNSSGTSWASGQTPGFDAPIGSFYIATPSSSITDINNALDSSKSLILTPGIYKYSEPIHVTQPGTVVLGMGYATIVPQAGTPGMIVEDVDNVQVAGLLFDAGPVDSPMLLEVGTPGLINNNHSSAPSSLNDIFFRVGGATLGMTDEALQIDSGDVIMDNIWAWRADHGNPGTFGWTANTAAHGVVVNGTLVEALGLAVEHFQQEQTVWNGEGGATIFYQSELPYDPPSQAAWSSSTQNGYPSYVVSPSAGCSHQAYGLGIYSYFDQNVNIVDDNAVIVPNTVGTNVVDVGTVFLNGAGQIANVINGIGGMASTANAAKLVPVSSFSGTAPCQSNQYSLPAGSTVPLQAVLGVNPNNYDTPQVMAALQAVHPDLTVMAAHRGFHALAGKAQAQNIPENSLKAIELAAQEGWEAAEVDVQLTSDAVPILSHDKTWGREWCSYNPSLSAPFQPDPIPFDPFAMPQPLTPGSDASNNAKDPLVTQTPLSRTHYWNTDNTEIRDSVNLVANNRSGYEKGCALSTLGLLFGAYPPTLSDVFTDMNRNHIHMVLFLDVKTLAAASAIWKLLYPPDSNGQALLDDQGRAFAHSVIFKMDARLFPNGASDFVSTFPINTQAVNFMPLFTSGGLPEPVPQAGTPLLDTEAAGFDASADFNTNAPFFFASEQAMIDWLNGIENYNLVPENTTPGYINVAAVEVVMKEPGGLLSSLFNAAQTNMRTGSKMAVADFNAVGDFYPPDNSNSSVTPQYYRSTDGTCCDYLTHYLYNNPDGNGQIDPSKGFDKTDQRSDPKFIAGLNLGTVNSDDPKTLAGVLGTGKRNTCYMSANYQGGPCSTTTTTTGPANGTYTITNANSGLVMDVVGNSKSTLAAVDQYTANGGANQQWQITLLGAGLYRIVAVNSGLCLDVNSGSTQPGATMDQYTCNSTYTNQQFTVSATSDGNYTIVASNSGLAVEVPGSATEPSTVLDQRALNGLPNQEWTFGSAVPPTGTYTITNVNSGLVMDVTGGSTSSKAIVDQYTSLGSTNQQWQLKYLSSGLYNLISVKSGLCLDVIAGSTQKGAGLDQYTCNPTYANQQFTLTPAAVGGWIIVGKGSGLLVEVPGSSTGLSVALDQWTANQGKSQAWNFTPVN